MLDAAYISQSSLQVVQGQWHLTEGLGAGEMVGAGHELSDVCL